METAGFPQLEIQRKSGAEPFWSHSRLLPISLLDFWQWAVSNLVSNVTRGVLAEYIVATALGRAEGIRTPWEAFDLLTSTGVRVEVKSASYLQSWYHKALSRIVFTIRPTRAWTAETNAWAAESQRQADVYIFCILAHQEKASLDPAQPRSVDFLAPPQRCTQREGCHAEDAQFIQSAEAAPGVSHL